MSKGDYSTLDLAGAFQNLGLCLKTTGEVGKHFVTCPWAHEHGETGPTDTVIWQDGSGWPTFHCSHAHCDGRDTLAVIDWANSQRSGIIDGHCSRLYAGGASTYQRSEPAPSNPVLKTYQPSGERTELPEALDNSPADFLRAIFAEDELVSIERQYENGTGFEKRIRTVRDWCEQWQDQERVAELKGVYYCINPLKTADSRAGANASAWRNCLVELEVPKSARGNMTVAELKRQCEIFYAALCNAGLPLRAIYTSGGPSIHGLVAIDAASEQEFKERVAQVYEYCSTMPGLDPANKDQTRLSRLPGAYHGANLQALLYLKPEADWEGWKKSVEPRLFEIEDPLSWTTEQIEHPPVVIDGWLHKGHLAMLSGSAKTNKSWTLLELALCLATGNEWLGRKCTESTVLYIDAEIQRPFWRSRAVALCNKRDLSYQDVMATKRIRPAFVRGKEIKIAALRLELERLFEAGDLVDVSVIILDPIYQFYEEAWDENGNSDMAKLGRTLLAIAEATGISILFAHHHTKGSQEGKRDIEKAAGGAFSRFVASSLAITLIDEEARKFTLGWTTTNFPPSPKQVAYRDEFGWTVTDEDPKEAVRNHRSVDQIMECLPDDGASSENWLALCQAKFPITQKALEVLRPKAKQDGRVHFVKFDNLWKPTVDELERRQSTLKDGQQAI